MKTSVTAYIHATTYIHVKPIFTQALMIWLNFFFFWWLFIFFFFQFFSLLLVLLGFLFPVRSPCFSPFDLNYFFWNNFKCICRIVKNFIDYIYNLIFIEIFTNIFSKISLPISLETSIFSKRSKFITVNVSSFSWFSWISFFYFVFFLVYFISSFFNVWESMSKPYFFLYMKTPN